MADKIKRLSTAIRLGCVGTEQGFYEIDLVNNKVCALGAALIVLNSYNSNKLDTKCKYEYLEKRFPYTSIIKDCPERKCIAKDNILNMCCHLNDCHGKTRESIANWLEVIEDRMGI